MDVTDLSSFLTLILMLLGCGVCQNPIPNGPATEQPTECAAPNCDCCVTKDCNTCNGKCIEGIFGGRCRNKCPDRCVTCDDYGATNTNYLYYGYCTECKPGYYSDPPDYFQCNYKCPAKCSSCQSATQCHTCNKGYYLVPSTQVYGECMACPSSCAACISPTSCSECKTQQFEGNACNNCITGFHGVNCSLSCPTSCKGGFCETREGTCKECNDGFYGTYCNNSCSSHCNGTTCNQNGVCDKGCRSGYSGDRCCVQGDGCSACSSNNKCSKCVDGKHGESCQKECPASCEEGTCKKEDGACVKPIEPGPKPLPLGAIVGGIVGGLLLIAIIVVLVFCFVKRRQDQRGQTSGEKNVYYNVPDMTEPSKKAVMTVPGADHQITEYQLENERLKNENERLKEEIQSLRSEQVASNDIISESQYTRLDRKRKSENMYEGLRH